MDEHEEQWIERDDGNGNMYFENTTTGETAWEKPLHRFRNLLKMGALTTSSSEGRQTPIGGISASSTS